MASMPGRTPSVARLNPGSPDTSVFFGAGTAAMPHKDGYEAFSPTSRELWYVPVHNPGAAYKSGVVASLAVGVLASLGRLVGFSELRSRDGRPQWLHRHHGRGLRLRRPRCRRAFRVPGVTGLAGGPSRLMADAPPRPKAHRRRSGALVDAVTGPMQGTERGG